MILRFRRVTSDLMTRDPVQDQLQPPLYRVGAIGSSWRHVKQCFDGSGRFLTFVDGTVKIDDCRRYPPTGLAHISTDMEKIHGAFKRVHEMSKVQLRTLGRLMKDGPNRKKAQLIEAMFNPRMARSLSSERSPSTVYVKA
ncbi:hypothetical protein Ciccas_012392 [Cichlidogyrus casuarinus]|uniref:Uncharacterized protein n=1 Tax=Cichlidogyrus casuarinus TaxID=1844966 RepID=A0ABD2PQB3_9PLAT